MAPCIRHPLFALITLKHFDENYTKPDDEDIPWRHLLGNNTRGPIVPTTPPLQAFENKLLRIETFREFKERDVRETEEIPEKNSRTSVRFLYPFRKRDKKCDSLMVSS
ncbi:hypothetical protein CEXT_156911 [Caerostris extrusa]|uniref:Uncharacterized protein n=1 Tax=Caerostris extrusa TaxID=172846 RepID=A0AAV4S2L5_CAEEX|nr:hypothetical protein CEXT_156911 [Caerostris extrusa]